RKVLVSILADLGITAEQAVNGEDALKMVLAAADAAMPYDMIFMDWRMPGMDGIETTKQIHSLMAENPPNVLMVSAYDKDEARLQLGQTPVKQFLEKPVSQKAILDAITLVLAGDGATEVQIEQAQEHSEEVFDFSTSHILLVEDNAINRQVALGFLYDTQVKIDIAENGLIALEKIKQHNYDLVLMDIQMPEMDGITATKEIRNTLKIIDLPIIAMTAHAMQADEQRSLDSGMNGHINKPIDPDVLNRTLANYLENNVSLSTSTPVDTDDKESSILKQLAQVKGLDTAQALARMKGKTGLYLTLVKDFDTQQRSLDQQLKTMFDNQQWDELYRTIHSLKSNAAYIGAFGLSQLGEKLETELGQAHYDEHMLAQLCSMLAPLLTDLQSIFEQHATVQNETVFSAELLTDTLNMILPLLETSCFSAEDHMSTLSELCANTQFAAQVAEIVDLVDDIEYDSAFEKASDLLEELGAYQAAE
ncbi:MAG: response regulator, partial [Algicola sp.]|nr:response regulator [Algicola sp.]